jgi:hypothetical protein
MSAKRYQARNGLQWGLSNETRNEIEIFGNWAGPFQMADEMLFSFAYHDTMDGWLMGWRLWNESKNIIS